MKRILIFSLAYLPMVGGAEIAIKEITDRIPREDIAFDMITLRFNPSDKDVERIGNVRVYRVKYLEHLGYLGKIMFPFFAALGTRRLHARNDYDGAWAMMSYMTFPLMLVRVFGTALPYALTLQEGDTAAHVFGRWYIRIFLPLLRSGFRRAAIIQTISTYLAGWAREQGCKGEVVVIANGVDGTRFSREIAAEEKIALREKYGLHENDVVLVTSSRLVKKNGVDLVVRALPQLPAEVKFLIAGSGPERAALEMLVQELGLGGRVIFAGHVDNAQLPAYLHASDIFIRASRSEGQGIAFIEAMAAGLPTVAPQIGGITDFLFDEQKNPEHEPTGFAIEPESPASIAEVVQKIIDDPLRAHQIAVNAQRMVLHEYDWEKIAQEMRERVFAKIFEK